MQKRDLIFSGAFPAHLLNNPKPWRKTETEDTYEIALISDCQ